MTFKLLITALALCSRMVSAKFGFTNAASVYQIDTGGGLTFDVNKNTGDIVSLIYKGTQYQASDKGTHINSGLAPASVSTRNVGSDYVVTTIKSEAKPVTQYYVAKKGESKIYIATDNKGKVEPGELRFIARLRKANVPIGVKHPVADVGEGTAIEGKDVFKVGSQTRCKFFSSTRFIDDVVHYVSGKGTNISLTIPPGAYETSSGGPFMRDINNQGTNDQQEFYYYMNSGHLRTEDWRMGLKGPYVLSFSPGPVSDSNIDTTFFAKLGIPGYVPHEDRGTVSGVASGVPAKFETVLHWHNTQNQYWTYAKQDGSFKSPLMKPGQYTMVLYKQEFKVAEKSVKVEKGQNTATKIASAESNTTPIWRIGEFDGQPFEFKNGEKFNTMHPSDGRMSSWGGTFTVGKSTAKDFPMAIFSKVGGPVTVNFKLNETMASSKLILRVGTTLSFKGGRPVVKMGDWEGGVPEKPQDLDSRGVTRGGYRGFGEVYEWKIKAGALKAGENKLTLSVGGGGGDVGFLSSNYIVDAIELAPASGQKELVPETPVGKKYVIEEDSSIHTSSDTPVESR